MSERPTSGPAPRWGEYAPVPPPEPVPAERPVERVAPGSAAADGDRTERPARSWDLALTVGLLALGTLNVLTGIPAMLNLGDTLRATYAAVGYGDYTSDGLASGVGIAINIVHVVLLIAAVALSTASLRARRITFWIPLVFGAVATIVAVVLFAVAMLGDPALPAYIDQMSQSGPAAS